MSTKFLVKKGICFLLCALLTGILAGAPVDSDYQDANCVSEYSEHKELYDILGLREDATASQIIQLLDVPVKRTFSICLIRHRKISTATPKLLKIVRDVNENNVIIMNKISAAEALCDFGNREWMPIIKALSTDPNGMISRTSYKFRVAGLLARAGDYSQFNVVAKGVSDSKDYIRSTAIYELRNFGHKTDPVTDSAVKLLSSVATSDAVPRLRDDAITSLEKIAKLKPEVTSKVTDALQANINSADKNLRTMCRAKLEMYSKQSKTD